MPDAEIKLIRVGPPPVKMLPLAVGPKGDQGEPGPAGGEAVDPGDLTLIFNNHLI